MRADFYITLHKTKTNTKKTEVYRNLNQNKKEKKSCRRNVIRDFSGFLYFLYQHITVAYVLNSLLCISYSLARPLLDRNKLTNRQSRFTQFVSLHLSSIFGRSSDHRHNSIQWKKYTFQHLLM